MKKTKVICTVGPSSEKEDTLRKLLLAGMNVARINCSHGSHEEHRSKIETFRKVRDELGMPAAVLLDTKGPEIRLGTFKGGKAFIKEGQSFILTTKAVDGDENISHVKYERLPQEIMVGDSVLIDDGKITLRVLEVKDRDIICQVINGGMVSNNKGVNLPDVSLSMDYISEADHADLLFGIEMDVDYVAASFVRNRDDVITLRKLLVENGGEKIKIISKIESTEGLENFEEILKESDGIMIARGDMGVEVPFQRLPGIQKNIIRRCLQSGKLAITATQMLESMIENPSPTRAEITDVANAVFDGTSAIMLSGETAAGSYPVEAVAAMNKIAMQAEDDMPKNLNATQNYREMNSEDVTNAVGHSACTLAGDIKAGAIMAITKTGYTARRMSKFRPNTPIVGLTAYEKTFHQLALEWGVIPSIIDRHDDLEEIISKGISRLLETDVIEAGDKVVISCGMPLDVPGNTNIIRVETARI